MRAPEQTSIPAPPIPTGLPWVNVKMLRMDQQAGRPVLVEFSDLTRPSSLRTNDYMKAWHERYGQDENGLRVITVFAPAFAFSAEPETAERLVHLAGIEHPVLLDLEHRLWKAYDNEGWPSRYLFDRELKLFEYHFGEGGYEETEAAIRVLCGEAAGAVEQVGSELHPIDRPDARIVVPSPDEQGCWSGSYEAGEVWAVFEGSGTITVGDHEHTVDGPGPLLLVRHDEHTSSELRLGTGDGVTCHAVCFSPGPAPAGA